MPSGFELDELVEYWTLLDGERELVAGKRGTTRLVFALMLKFYGRHGRFPDGDGDPPREVVLPGANGGSRRPVCCDARRASSAVATRVRARLDEKPGRPASFERRRREWTLFWRDRNHRWHRYKYTAPTTEIARLLEEIDRDPTGIFWG